MFQLPKNYPDVGPTIEIFSSKNLEDCDELEIVDILNDMTADNIGMVMVFTMVTRASEWLNTLKERKIIERKQAEEQRKKEIEEMERKKFEGTRVTVETFIAWKMKFDAEMATLAAKNKEMKKGLLSYAIRMVSESVCFTEIGFKAFLLDRPIGTIVSVPSPNASISKSLKSRLCPAPNITLELDLWLLQSLSNVRSRSNQMAFEFRLRLIKVRSNCLGSVVLLTSVHNRGYSISGEMIISNMFIGLLGGK